MSEIYEAAKYWVSAGVGVIPIRYMDKRPDAKLLPDGKWESFKTQLPTDQDLLKWFPGNLHNLGIVTGWQNLVVIDFDDLGMYVKWSVWATRTGGMTRRSMELTYQVTTARGVHVYFRTQQPEQNRKLDGIDIKARGGYVLGVPSVHPTNVPYTVKQSGIPMLIEALSDVLPASYLLQNTELPPTIAPQPIAPVILSADPWEQIMRVSDPDKDLVTQIRGQYRIENFFTDIEKTSSDGRWWVTPCPFHDDKHPSFWIDASRQICSCYGSCTPKPLDVINLYARLHGLTNRDAIYAMRAGL
jgi:hypothetical protein